MKNLKIFFCNILFLLAFSKGFCDTDVSKTKDLLNGLWENQNRFVFIDDSNCYFYFKTYYTLHYEKTGNLSANIEATKDGAVMNIKYAFDRNPFPVQVGIINDKMYLNYFVKGSSFKDENPSHSREGFWRCCGNVDLIGIAEPCYKKEVTAYYFKEDEVYILRYWETDMDYSESDAYIIEDNERFAVDKFIRIGNRLYTCVTGRSTTIRNLHKEKYTIKDDRIFIGNDDKGKDILFSEDGLFMTMTKPYLEKSSVKDLEKEMKEHNSIVIPAKPFPLKSNPDLDFHYDLIRKARKQNQQ